MDALSSVRKLPLHADAYGAYTLHRSRRLAFCCLFLVTALCLSLLVLVQPVRSVRMSAAPPPLRMDMRTLPPPPPPAQKPPERTPLLAEQGPFSVAKPPVPPKEAVREKTPPPEKARPKTPVPKPVKARAHEPRPAPKAVEPPPMPNVAAMPATGALSENGTDAPNAAASGTGTSAQATPQDRATALGVLMQAIERHKSYPKQARRTGAQGTVSLLVHVGRDGRVKNWEVYKASGQTVLDLATRQLGEKLAGLDTGVRGKEVQVVVPVSYSLR